MNEGRVKIKLVKLHEELDKRTTAKGQDIYPIKADIEVETVPVEDASVTAWGEKALEAFKAGKELDGATREWRGSIEYTVFPEREKKSYGGGGGGGGFRGGKSPVEQASIRRQCAFKGAIELIAAGKLEIGKLSASVDEMDKIISGE